MRHTSLFLVLVSAGFSACRPAPAASVRSLDNFASRESKLRTNQCVGSFPLSASLRIYAEPGRVDLMNGLKATVAAVPPAIQDTFFATDGGAVVATVAQVDACAQPGNGAAVEERFTNEGSAVPMACLRANDARRKATIFVQPEATAAKHAVVRMFGLLYAHVYGPKKFANWRQASELLANGFLADVAGNPRLSIKAYEALLGTPEGYASFVDFVFAEAFDSYYCNADTRKHFSATFPRTFQAFATLRKVWEPQASAAFALQDGSPESQPEVESAQGGSDYWSSISSLSGNQPGPSPGVFAEPAGLQLPPELTDSSDAMRPADEADARQAAETQVSTLVGVEKQPAGAGVDATPPSEEDLLRVANADLLTRGIRSPQEYKRVAKAFGDDVASQVQWETDKQNIPSLPENAAERVRAVIDMYGFASAGTKGAKEVGKKTLETAKNAADQAAVEEAKTVLSDDGKVVVDLASDLGTVAGDLETVATSPHLAPLVLAANSLEAQQQKKEALEKILGPSRDALESQGKDIVAKTLADPVAGRAALDKAVMTNPYSTGYLRAQYWRAFLARNGGKN